METQTASVYSTASVPRLRVTRHTTTSFGAESASSIVPRHTDLKRALSYPDSQTTSEDDSATLPNATRLLSASLPPPDSTHSSADTAHRLRAVLNRSRPPPSVSRVVMPPSPSEPESDFDLPPAQAARVSIKDLFNHALREPGDTPQKPRPTRRASFNAVGSPKVSKSRRKSTSDEEREILTKRHDERPADLSTAASLDRLRLQLTESMPSIDGASSSTSTSRPPSEATVSTPKRATPSHHIRASKIPVSQSPVRHVKSHQDLEPFAPVNGSEHGDLFSPQRQKPDPSHPPRTQTPSQLSHANVSASVTRQHSHDPIPHGPSRTNSTTSDADYRERLREFKHETDVERERDWNRRHPPPPTPRLRTTSTGQLNSSAERNTGRVSPGAWPTPPPPGSSPSSTRSPRGSLTGRDGGSADGHSEDGRSSRGTSASSNAEYRERLKEAERERQRELERSWNRPQPQHSQSVPHLHVEETHPHGSRPVSALGQSHSHSRPHSRISHDHARTASPASSTSSRSHHDDEVEEEVEHERERNWNAPRPKWGQHPHHHGPEADDYNFPRSASPLPPHTPKGHSRPRTSSATSIADGHSQPRPHSRLQTDRSRPHSRVDHDHDRSRSGSPASSVEEELEELHERERNWNAPRPKWDPHAHHQHGVDPHLSPALAHDPSAEKSWGRHRTNSSLGVPVNGHSPRPVSPSPRNSTSHHTVRSKSPVPPPRAHPRPNSPLAPPSSEKGKAKAKGKAKDMDADREKGWNSPKVSPSHRHERTPSSPSPVPSRPGSRASNNGSLGRASSGSAVRVRRSSSPTPLPGQASTDAKKGHRRTITELSESMGPFPRQTELPPSLAVPDESNLSMFADESVPPPQMSTPTFKATQLPDLSISSDASDIPLPPSPPSPVAATRADADLARLQRAVAPEFTFPARRPSPPFPTAADSLSTPPRRASFNTQRLEFRTPSPPVGLPELPGPPSSDEEDVKTPIRANGEAKPLAMTLSAVKTPRFPGAYGTPAPPHVPVIPSTPEEDESVTEDEVEATPKLQPIDVSSSRVRDVGEMPSPVSVPPTPAPPGAYRATPTPAKRKGILKVRFDGDVQTSADIAVNETATNGDAVKPKESTPPPSPSSEDIPPLSLSPSRRKGLRLVDEYGRERRFTEDGEEIVLDSRRKSASASESPKPPSPVDDTTMTPRRRAKMRQLDELGNEVTVEQEVKEEPNGEVPEARGKKAVFSRLTRSLGELRDDLAEEEDALAASVPENGPRDDERLMELASASRAARVERNRLARKLQLERNAEGGIADKVFVARHPSRDLSSDASNRGSWWKRKWRLVVVIFILEMVILFIGYRLAMIHAKHAWLTTYYDPFFPAIYLHKSRPSFLSRFGTLPVDWSAFAITGAVRRVGVRGFVVGVGKRLWEEMWSWRMEPWEAWGSPAAGPPVPRAWPS